MGTKEYFDEIARLMEESAINKGDKKLAELTGNLRTADITYLLVKTPIGGPPSSVDKLFAATFYLKPKVP